MRSRTAILVACAILLGAPLLTTGAAGANRAAVVIVFGNGRIDSRCLEFGEADITGGDLLTRSGHRVRFTGFTGLGAGVCAIDSDGCGQANEDCFCQCPGNPCSFWSYWHWRDGKWQYSQDGASSHRVRNGDVDGWVWGDGKTPPPSPDMNSICPPPTEPPTPVSPTAIPTKVAPPPSATPKPTKRPSLVPTAVPPTAEPPPTATSRLASPTPQPNSQPTRAHSPGSATHPPTTAVSPPSATPAQEVSGAAASTTLGHTSTAMSVTSNASPTVAQSTWIVVPTQAATQTPAPSPSPQPPSATATLRPSAALTTDTTAFVTGATPTRSALASSGGAEPLRQYGAFAIMALVLLGGYWAMQRRR
jgi:hypothetical protein